MDNENVVIYTVDYDPAIKKTEIQKHMNGTGNHHSEGGNLDPEDKCLYL